MSSGGQVQTVHLLTWIVAFIGIAANLIWNWRNRIHTNDLGVEIRRERYQQDQWARIRTKIENAVDDLVESVVTAPVQIQALSPGTDPKVFLDMLNLNIVNNQDALARALRAAEESDDCSVLFWDSAQWGSDHGDETSWDILLSKFSTARDEKDIKTQVTQLAALKPYVLEIYSAVAELIRRQDVVLKP